MSRRSKPSKVFRFRKTGSWGSERRDIGRLLYGASRADRVRDGKLPSDAVAERSYPQRDFSRPPEAIEILLVRHGASEAAVEGQTFEQLEGQAAPSLSERGERQARAVAAYLAGRPIDALFITPLCRTAQTAAPITAATGLEPVVVPELREVHLGDLDGGAFRIALHNGDPIIPEVFKQERWDVIPGAEPMADFAGGPRAGLGA